MAVVLPLGALPDSVNWNLHRQASKDAQDKPLLGQVAFEDPASSRTKLQGFTAMGTI